MNSPEQDTWKQLAHIFWTFFKMGPLTFGGGFAMIPAIEHEVVEKNRWLDEDEVMDVFAVAGSAPGAIAVNAAIFVGYKLKGLKGAIAALLGILLPTFMIVIALCIAYLNAQNYPKVQAALEGIGAATVALIVSAGIRMGKTAILDVTTFLAAAGSFVFLVLVPVNPIYVLVIGCLLLAVFINFKSRLGYTVSTVSNKKKTTAYKYSDYFIGDGI
jgi:chromate transporter